MTDDSPIRDRKPIAECEALEMLAGADVDIIGRMPWSSNGTFLVDLVDEHGEVPAQGIYKPARTERPLWDFPSGLHRREVATYELSRQLGWDLVPPTIERSGPLGVGSLQLFVPTDYDEHYFTIAEAGTHIEPLQRLCVLDIVANSTDRKGGHCLVDTDGRVWAIDNGLTFHQEFKLRTVIWQWAGDRIPQAILDDLAALVDDGLTEDLAALLDPFERDATLARARAVMTAGRFPTDPSGRRHPWPLL
jgi:uncharacterized repeat protein (TIGR03843 family)